MFTTVRVSMVPLTMSGSAMSPKNKKNDVVSKSESVNDVGRTNAVE